MISVETILAKIVTLRDEHAVAALATPRERDSFEYGKQHGMYLGFEKVHRAITVLLEEDAQLTTEEEMRE